MFTGIITNLGKLVQITKSDNNDLELLIAINKSDINRNLEIGCSISCNGICLTLIEKLILTKISNLNFKLQEKLRIKQQFLTGKLIN